MGTRARHLLTRILSIAALCAVSLTVAACGSSGSSGGSHHLLSKAFCLYNVDRAFHDFRTGHKVYGALNVAMAVHNCEHGFGHHT